MRNRLAERACGLVITSQRPGVCGHCVGLQKEPERGRGLRKGRAENFRPCLNWYGVNSGRLLDSFAAFDELERCPAFVLAVFFQALASVRAGIVGGNVFPAVRVMSLDVERVYGFSCACHGKNSRRRPIRAGIRNRKRRRARISAHVGSDTGRAICSSRSPVPSKFPFPGRWIR